MTEEQWIACRKVDAPLWFLGDARKVARSHTLTESGTSVSSRANPFLPVRNRVPPGSSTAAPTASGKWRNKRPEATSQRHAPAPLPVRSRLSRVNATE